MIATTRSRPRRLHSLDIPRWHHRLQLRDEHGKPVRASDAAGNRDPLRATHAWTISAAPDTSITSGPSGTTRSSSASFEFTSSEVNSSFECKLDSASWVACSSPQALTGLSDGPHIFSVRATDQAGNTDASPATTTWTSTAPRRRQPRRLRHRRVQLGRSGPQLHRPCCRRTSSGRDWIWWWGGD